MTQYDDKSCSKLLSSKFDTADEGRGDYVSGHANDKQVTYANVVSYLAFGFKAEPVEGLVFELGVLQNLIDPENTADFSILANVALRL